MQLSVIIVNYNVKQLLLDCVSSLKGNVSGIEVIVVDNCSTDGSVVAVKEAFPDVNLIVNTENKGFSAANNQGLSIARGEWLLLLNPDTKLTPGALNLYHSFAEQEGRSGIYGAKLLNEDGSLQKSAWKLNILGQIIADCFFLGGILSPNTYPDEKFDTVFEAGFLSGAALLFHRSLYEKLGGLDPDLFWMEDVDLCYRNHRQGGKNIFYPGAGIYHFSGQSARRNFKISISNQLISKLKFFKKHSQKAAFILGAVFIFKHIILRLILFFPLGLMNGVFYRKWIAYAYTLPKLFSYLFTGKKAIA